MTGLSVVVAVDAPAGHVLAAGLEREGVIVRAVVPADAIALVAEDALRGDDARICAEALAGADAVVLEVGRASLTPAAVHLCDRRGLRIVPVAAPGADARMVGLYGLAQPWPTDAEPWRIADALRAAEVEVAPTPAAGPRTVIAVWGAAGSPGRSTIAIELAVELARGGRHVALVDADTHAPSLALALGLADEGPGFAAACRQAEQGELDARELTRIAVALAGTGVDVLTGINRPSRWPELSAVRVAAALETCRDWADFTVVDVAASLERDEEIVSDLDGPRRNAATIAALRAADLVIAVAGADPVGVSRFLRAHAELRATIGATPVAVVANRLRPGTLGIDARGQIRRTLDRFGGIGDVWFLPTDPRSADAALLQAQPIASVAPKSPFTAAMRRFVGDVVVPVAAPEAADLRRRAVRRSRRVPATAVAR
ncbi:AAA family ATPase [Microbacterium terricola]|uniref:Pilus biosynthesis protein CpaE n=1 Tax=Microbacterium terricola TaxID=344163 RepID=A0ABM8DWV4_9MICO|nr:P-loop NTPase [Microbacterium terricola]UYK39196.1 P-loop NTPase [Microbacterium terricola]BDV30085.1 pilus biosynthesis protein CpaE [Microbacterium terricola]